VPVLSSALESLRFPLIFVYGTTGWTPLLRRVNKENDDDIDVDVIDEEAGAADEDEECADEEETPTATTRKKKKEKIKVCTCLRTIKSPSDGFHVCPGDARKLLCVPHRYSNAHRGRRSSHAATRRSTLASIAGDGCRTNARRPSLYSATA